MEHTHGILVVFTNGESKLHLIGCNDEECCANTPGNIEKVDAFLQEQSAKANVDAVIHLIHGIVIDSYYRKNNGIVIDSYYRKNNGKLIKE